MTTQDTAGINGPYTCNGVTVDFDFLFKIEADTEILVELRNTTTGVRTTVSSNDYTVVRSANGGTVTMDTAPATGNELFMYIDPGFGNDSSFERRGGINETLFNTILDRLAQRLIRLREDVRRSLKFPLGDPEYTLPDKISRRDRMLAFADTLDAEPIAGPLVAQVEAVSNIISDIVRISENLDAIEALHDDLIGDGNVITVANLETEIQSLAAIDNEISDLSAVVTQIGLLGAISTEIDDLHNYIGEITYLYSVRSTLSYFSDQSLRDGLTWLSVSANQTAVLNAATNATAAAASAVAALASENAAALSEAAASASETAAQTAETNAQAAQTAAEAARDAAQTAQTAAETAQAASETARDAAVSAQTATETARDAALAAQAAAETAETGAQTAQTAAESARDAAVSAQAAAESARDSAQAAAAYAAIIPNSTVSSELTISGGSITPNRAAHTVDTQSDGATDDLDTIDATNFKVGDVITLAPANDARTVVVKSGTGNIVHPEDDDTTLDNINKTIQLRWDGTNWAVLSNGVPRHNPVFTGNMAIGVTSTTRNLHVESTGGTQVVFASAADQETSIGLGNSGNYTAGEIVYDNDTGTMRFGVAGTDRMFIDNAGQVGIAVSVPGAPLDVSGIIRARNNHFQVYRTTNSDVGLLRVVDSGGNNAGQLAVSGLDGVGGNSNWNFQSSIGNVNFQNTGAVNITNDLSVGGTDLFIDASANKVGIGTSGIGSTKLAVKSGDTGGGDIAHFDDSGSGSTGRLAIATTGGTSTDHIRLEGVNRAGIAIGTASTSQLYVEMGTGDVGIGLLNPAVALDVARSGTSTIRTQDLTNSVDLRLSAQSGVGMTGTWSNDDFLIRTNDTEVARFKIGGQLALGTTSADSMLHVKGTTGVMVESDGNANYGLFADANHSTTMAEIGALDSTDGAKAGASVVFSDFGQSISLYTGKTSSGTRTEFAKFVHTSNRVGFGETDPQGSLHITHTGPSIYLEDSDAATNQKVYRWSSASGDMYLQTQNDDYTFGAHAYRVERTATGAGILAHHFYTNGTVRLHIEDGGANVTGDLDVTGTMTVGSFALDSLTIDGEQEFRAAGVTDLRAIATASVSVGARCYLFYHTSRNDFGHGWFELISATTADDGGMNIRPNDYAASTNEKVWARVADEISVNHFGAQPDDTTDSVTQIQAAEDYCAALNREVSLRFHGRFGVNNTIDKKANVSWVGNGNSRIRRLDDGPTYAALSYGQFALVLADEVDDWSIAGMEFKAIPHNLVGDNTNPVQRGRASKSVDAGTAPGNWNSCVQAYKCENWDVYGCTFREFSQGIMCAGSGKFRILNNKFYSDISGYTVADVLAGTAHSSFGQSGSGAIKWLYDDSTSLIVKPETRGGLVQGNTIICPGLDGGIQLGTNTFGNNEWNIANNRIEGVHCGIQLYSGSREEDDEGTYSTSSDSYNNGSIITANHIYATWEQGIYIRGTIGVQVLGNYIERTAQLNAGSDASYGGIITRVNPFSESPDTYDSASSLSDAHMILIQGNRVINTGRQGVDVAGTYGICVRMNNIRVIGNDIVNPSEEFSTSTLPGIIVANGAKLKNFYIENNNITGFFENGILVTDVLKSADYKTDFGYIGGNNIQIEGQSSGQAGVNVQWYSFNVTVEKNHIVTGSSGTGVVIRFSPFTRVLFNKIVDSTKGVEIQERSLASAMPYFMSAGSIGDTKRRGSTVDLIGNEYVNVTTPHATLGGTTGDSIFIGRVRRFQDEIIDGAPYIYEFDISNLGTYDARTWSKHMVAANDGIAGSASPASYCISPGTFGVGSASTGATTSGSAVITSVSSLDGYGIGQYLNPSAGFSGVVKIVDIDIDNDTITVDENSTGTGTGRTLNWATPTFKAAANLAA